MPIPREVHPKLALLFSSLRKSLQSEERLAQLIARAAFKTLLKNKLGLNGQVTDDDLVVVTKMFGQYLLRKAGRNDRFSEVLDANDANLTLGAIWNACSKSFDDQVADWLNDGDDDDKEDDV